MNRGLCQQIYQTPPLFFCDQSLNLFSRVDGGTWERCRPRRLWAAVVGCRPTKYQRTCFANMQTARMDGGGVGEQQTTTALDHNREMLTYQAPTHILCLLANLLHEWWGVGGKLTKKATCIREQMTYQTTTLVYVVSGNQIFNPCFAPPRSVWVWVWVPWWLPNNMSVTNLFSALTIKIQNLRGRPPQKPFGHPQVPPVEREA